MPEIDDDNDNDLTPRGIQRRLNRVVTLLERANAQLNKINAGFAEPPSPDKPAMITSLNAIKTQALTSTRVADGLLGRLR